MCTVSMPRKQANYRLDDRVVDAIQRIAMKHNISANRYLENLLFAHAKELGEIHPEASPLGETRGGDRKKLPDQASSETQSDS